MGYQKFNGILKEVLEQQLIESSEVLQDALQIPLDKAEELTNRIKQKYCSENEKKEKKIVKKLVKKQADSSKNRVKKNCYTSSVGYLSNEEFERLIVWLFEELEYEVQPELHKRYLGFDFVVRKESEKIAVLARKYSSEYKLTKAILDFSENAQRVYDCTKSIVVATTFFTDDAVSYSENMGVELWNIKTIAEKIELAKRKTEVQTEKNFPKYKGTLKHSLLKLADEKDFVIESRNDGVYDLYLFGVKYPLLTFQAESEAVTKCVYRIRYNEPVGENEGEVLINSYDDTRVGPEDMEAYKLIIEYLEQFLK